MLNVVTAFKKEVLYFSRYNEEKKHLPAPYSQNEDQE